MSVIRPCQFCGSESAGMMGWITPRRWHPDPLDFDAERPPDVRTCQSAVCRNKARLLPVARATCIALVLCLLACGGRGASCPPPKHAALNTSAESGKPCTVQR